MQILKMNALLAKVEHGQAVFRKMTAEFTNFFNKVQGSFVGVRKTYEPKEGAVDNPSMRQNTMVVTTVREKFDWYEENAREYINSTLAVDATNASNTYKTPLVVEGFTIANLSTLELMKLKSLLTKMGIQEMYDHIPVRSDTQIWTPTTEEMYEGREIFETALVTGVSRTSTKREIVLDDPNIRFMVESGKVPDVSKYNPVKSQAETMVEVGDYTVKHFSGEYTQRQKAEILRRRSILLEAVEVAIKQANDVPTVQSELTAEKLFGYLHRGVLS